jgi:hypothetical protein
MPSFSRTSRRPLLTRPLLLGCALLSAVGVSGCKTEELHPVPKGWTGVVNLEASHGDVDVLFVIDDSSGMAAAQDNLIRNFPTFMATLQADPAGPRNVHIAVVSQDLGAGGIAGCDDDSNGLYPKGKRGVFQYTPRGTCSATNLEFGATYIRDVSGLTNYTGAVEDVFACIAPLGESGCGFNHQLAALLRAVGVDGSPAPAENQGFLRPDAVLAIVMLTNEDDCSAAPGVPLFDSSSNMNIASQLGPPIHFRCNEFGHLCPRGGGTGPHPDRNAPNNDVTATVSYDACVSNDAEGYLLSTTETANRIKALKSDPSRVVVASIQGSPAPYAVHWTNPTSADSSCGAASCPWPEITHACTAPDGRYGDPGVRTAQFAQQFGDNGLVLSVCDGSFGPGLATVAATINRNLGPTCIPSVSLDSAGDPDCKVALRDGMLPPASIPSCHASGGLAPCWRLVPAPTCSPGLALEVSVDPNTPHVYSPLVATYDCAK